MKLTQEQQKYINCDNSKHTKLLACAGSGKTKCIILRINKMINDGYKQDEILVLSFSKLTKDDFINKIKDSNIENIKTIDSYAKSIIDKDNNIDVELLSYQFMLYLQETKKEDIDIKIKYVFIDEAQDLNEIQYNIFCLMKNKLDIKINMIGDPNQNIYQFRNSSDKYLKEFEGEIFILTQNFRSQEALVNFSSYLRPFNEYNIKSNKKDNGCKPIFFFHKNEKELETKIINILISAKEENIDMSDFAILSPTRGRMRGYGNSNGLCFISNILYKAKIKFKQFYEENNDGNFNDGIKYEKTKNHVNILTCMGSKGLEWKYVILLDANDCLIDKRNFEDKKHNDDRYLLYVSCTRAIENIYIFSNYKIKNSNISFGLNKWFKTIPNKYYEIENEFENKFKFEDIKYIKTQIQKEQNLKDIIKNISYEDLNKLSNIINYKNKKIIFEKKIYKNNYNFDNTSNFFIEYIYNYFNVIYNITHDLPKIKFDKIEEIILSQTKITNLNYKATQWYHKNKKIMNWDNFIKDNTIDDEIKNNILNNFDRDTEFNSHVVSESGFYQLFILEQKEWIKNIYSNYLKSTNVLKIRELLFYLVVVIYSIKTQHYYHIKSKGDKFKNILSDYKIFFDEIEEYIEQINYNFIAKDIIIKEFDIFSYVNFLSDNNDLWFVRCCNEISLKYILHCIVSYFMNNNGIIEENKNIVVNANFINLIKGNEIIYEFILNYENYIQIKNILNI